MVVDWAIGNGTCEGALKNMSSYACKSTNFKSYKPDNGYGYCCLCLESYQGNPYPPDGCPGMIFKNIYATWSSSGPQAFYCVAGIK